MEIMDKRYKRGEWDFGANNGPGCKTYSSSFLGIVQICYPENETRYRLLARLVGEHLGIAESTGLGPSRSLSCLSRFLSSPFIIRLPFFLLCGFRKRALK